MIAALNDFGRAWADLAVPLILQNTVFLLVLLGALHLVRRGPAAVRSRIAVVGLAKLLVPVLIPATILPVGRPHLTGSVSGGLLFGFTGNAPDPAAAGGGGVPLAAGAWVALVWVAVAAVVLVRTVQQNRRLVGVLRRAEPVSLPPGLAGVLGPGIGVLRSPVIAMPLTHGLLPGRIFVPADFDRWGRQEQVAALLHEQAHLLRRDGLVRIAESAARILYFWHPLLHVLLRRLEEYREMACDDVSVARQRISPLDYSRFLLGLAERAFTPEVGCGSASSLFKRRQELLKRVAYQVKEDGMRKLTRKQLGLALGILVLATAPLSLDWGTARSDTAPPPPQEELVRKPEGKTPPPPKPGHVKVVLAGEEILVDGRPTDLDGFTAAVRAASAAAPEHTIVHFECAPEVTLGRLFAVQERMREVGLQKVAYDGGEKGELPLVLPSAKDRAKLEGVPRSQVLDLRVAPGGKVTADGVPTGADKVESLVRRRLDAEPMLVVSVTLDRACRNRELVVMLDRLKRAGAKRVALNDPE